MPTFHWPHLTVVNHKQNTCSRFCELQWYV